jgi:hypothetical protein
VQTVLTWLLTLLLLQRLKRVLQWLNSGEQLLSKKDFTMLVNRY